jgi:hypothetical protein
VAAKRLVDTEAQSGLVLHDLAVPGMAATPRPTLRTVSLEADRAARVLPDCQERR